MSVAVATDRPVETVLSGPAASVNGARLLTGLKDALVVDVGGTTTDTAELVEGMVEVCESGARVGGFATHVKALNVRTIGLGGDSLICWHRDAVHLGPRRVAPVVWAEAHAPGGVNEALSFMESRLDQHPGSVFPQIVLAAVKGAFPFEPTPEEVRLYDILCRRPHALDELTEPLNLLSSRFISTARLEESGLVQRCGLTPTDILHADGRFRKWPPDAARRMLDILAGLARKRPEDLLEELSRLFEERLAKELLNKQIAKDVDVDAEGDSALSRHLMACILSGKGDAYSIVARLAHPVVGIGAPVHHFLPGAGGKLHAKVLVPEDADVANAIGAVASRVMIRQKASIRPDASGGFVVEGIEGCRAFEDIGRAEVWALDRLKTRVQTMGRAAGTRRRTVEVEIRDRIVNAAGGTALFLDRTIRATLSGRPDVAEVNARKG
jgi:N-methylhydantoinase A/oxoprolinase/acetone carboxylase beta subunit